ncbi:MAG: ATP-binding protein [Anaerolineae bacterium]
MRSDEELLALLHDTESDSVERKRSLADAARIRQAICAFANDLADNRQPGVVFVGAEDDGSCAGISVTDDLLLNLANMRSDGLILPFPAVSVQKRVLGGCELAVVQVEPSDSPPVRVDGRCWVRVGPRRATATPQEETRLAEKRRAGNLPYDQHAVPGASLSDLDLDLFRREYLPAAVHHDVLSQDTRSLPEQMAALRFLTVDSRPNVAAVLVFGKDPLQWLPAAYLQFLRVDGVDLTDPVRDQKELNGPLIDVLRQLDGLLALNLTTTAEWLEGATEHRQPDYPIVALQQLVRNALLHRTYEGTNSPSRLYWFADRVEVHSPGGLYGIVNALNFGQPGITDYRNPTLAEAMKVLGYVQRFGAGIATARKQAEVNGNPPIEFGFAEASFLATVRRRP